MPLIAIPAIPGPGHRFQSRLADGLPAFCANAKFLAQNPSQGIVDGTQEIAVSLLQTDLHGGDGSTHGDVSRVPAKLPCGGNRIGQALAVGDFLPL
jgi:hypothetical protein